jgi:D-alanyl-D-alanine carboxypeptidase
LAGLFALALTALAAAGARAEGRSAALVVDVNSGRVLFQSAADELRHPASLAKLMTLYLVFERMEQGRLRPDTRIKMSANAVAAAPSKLDLDEGAEIGLIDAIKALITKSANDVAVAVAEHVAGSEEKFAKLMTQKARQLGMAATTFRNASGLHDDEQLTTARDIATLALRLLDDFPKQYPLFATRTFAYNDETYRNHNTLLSHYPGTDGLKTGYTRASGFNLAASVRRGGKHVIGVVFGGATAASRNAAMRTYLNMALLKASTLKTRKPASAPALIARASPPPEPKIAAVPTPQRVARAAPHPTAGSAPPAASATSEQAAGPAISPPLEMARVRQVLIAPPDAAEPTAAGQPHSIEALLEEPSTNRDNAAERMPPAPRLRWVTAGAGGSPLPVSGEGSGRPALDLAPSDAPGSPPSTLDAQAAALARQETTLAAMAAAPATAVAAPPAAAARASAPPERNASAAHRTFQIQVGAYQSEAEAQRQLALVRERAPALVGGRPAVTQQVKQGDKLFHRARYGGFDAQAAQQACGELKRLKVDCIVLKAE